MSDSAEILISTQSNALQIIAQLSDEFRKVCSAEQGQIFSLGKCQGNGSSYIVYSLIQTDHRWSSPPFQNGGIVEACGQGFCRGTFQFLCFMF